MLHVVEKLVFDVGAATQPQARAIQHELSEGASEKVLQALEAMFDRLAAKGMHVRLNTLTVDLGTLTPQNLEAQISAKLLPLLEQKLTEKESSQDRVLFEPLANFKLEADSQSLFENWIYFMQHGVLPWWQGVETNFNPNQAFVELLKAHPKLMRQILQGFRGTAAQLRVKKQLTLESHLQLSQALTQQSDYRKLVEFVHFWQALVQFDLSAQSGKFNSFVINPKLWLAEFNAYLLAFNNNPADSSHFQQALQQANQTITAKLSLPDKVTLLRLMVVKPLSPLISDNGMLGLLNSLIKLDSTQQIQDITEHLQQLNLLEQQQIQQLLIKAGFNRYSVKQLATVNEVSKSKYMAEKENHALQWSLLPSSLAMASNKFTSQQSLSVSKLQLTRRSNNDLSSRGWKAVATSRVPTVLDEINSVTPADEAYIENAGMIILWPFLSRFFSDVGLVASNQFISSKHQERAIQLLHYSLYKETAINEHQLLLNKILCGWPISRTVETSFVPSEIEVTQSRDLMESITQHWKPLKNTSMDGFISAFLMREGKLTHEEYGWKLVVNRQGMDVLLDQLPWGIGMAHLPWMQETIYTEW